MSILFAQIIGAIAALHIFLGVINKNFVKSDSPPKWWKTLLDLTAAFPQQGASGAVGPYSPLMMRSRKAKGLPVPPPAAAILFLFGSLALSACMTPGGAAIKICELGHLPQELTAGVQCATQAALNPGDWQSLLGLCAAGIVTEQFNCMLQGIVVAVKGRIPSGASPDTQSELIITRLQVYLNAHKAQACVSSVGLL